MLNSDRPFVLSIGGFDPSGCAGVLADIKVFEECGVQGIAALTCNTIQTDISCEKIDFFEESAVLYQIKILLDRFPVSVIKIGLVQSPQIIISIRKLLDEIESEAAVIWDTVSAPTFYQTDRYSAFYTNPEITIQALNSVDLITPNIDELDAISSGTAHQTHDTMVLLKRGHETTGSESCLDTLYGYTDEPIEFKAPRLAEDYKKRGTGCVLSSAIAAYKSLGNDWPESIRMAKEYINQYLLSGQGLIGKHQGNDIGNKISIR